MSRRVKPYDRVRVVTSRFEDEGVPLGTVGYVIEEYADGNLEVEVSATDGSTIAEFVAAQDDLELAEK
jgi:hypothetical protein